MATRLKDYIIKNKVFTFLCIYLLILFVFGLCVTPFGQILDGLWTIFKTPDILITEYFELASVGAAFVNSALLSFVMMMLIKWCKVPFNGTTIAVVGIVSGFALFGKNLLNVWPIIGGAFLYAKLRGEKFGKYVHTAIFGTTLSPVVSELFTHAGWSLGLAIPIAILVGLALGFFLVPIANMTTNIHQGYVLYNTGIAAGCLLVLAVGIMYVLGFEFTTARFYGNEHTLLMLIFMLALSAAMIMVGSIMRKDGFKKGILISKYSGRAVTDYVVREGLSATLVNMGLLGIMCTLYVYFVGAPLNGITVGAILTVVTFGAYGKNARNVTYILIGGLIGHFAGFWNFATDGGAIAGILFATGMAPIGGQYGWFWGMLSGFIHVFIVKNASKLHAGLTLYSNGFAEMFDAILLLPVIEGLKGVWHNLRRKKEDEEE